MEPDTWRQSLDYLADQITQVEGRMNDQISPREFGQLEGKVDSLAARLGNIERDVETLTEKVDALTTLLTEAKGGWRALMWVGGISATLGGVVVSIAKYVFPSIVR